jgi:excisionase family DNA binding protein
MDMTQENKNTGTNDRLAMVGVNSRSDSLFFENQVWLSSEEAATYLRRSVGQVRNMVHRRQLGYRKFCRRLYFRRTDLDRVIETSHKRGF